MLRRGWNAARRLTGTWTVKAQRWSRPSRLFSTEAAHPERVIPVEAPTMKEAKVGRGTPLCPALLFRIRFSCLLYNVFLSCDIDTFS